MGDIAEERIAKQSSFASLTPSESASSVLNIEKNEFYNEAFSANGETLTVGNIQESSNKQQQRKIGGRNCFF